MKVEGQQPAVPLSRVGTKQYRNTVPANVTYADADTCQLVQLQTLQLSFLLVNGKSLLDYYSTRLCLA